MNRLLLLFLLAIPLAASAAAPARTYVTGSGPMAPLPFSKAVRVGDTVYVAGHLGLDPKTGQAASDPAQEIHAVLDAVKATLEEAGLQMDDLVSVQVYCTDLTLYERFNEIYRTYFRAPFPARAFLGTSALLRGAHVEVMGVAVKQAL
jgi:2-iminobutanoate/2-iminopropanoate deaminase